MITLHCRNVNDAYTRGMELINREGVKVDTRNGPAYKTDMPVTTLYRCPDERVLFSPSRDANPFFHFFESLWMLAGRNDVGYVSQFVSRMKEFSDDGQTFNAAYGYRWRVHFDQDQIVEAIKMLQKDRQTRRCIIGMWDPSYDITQTTKDMPCNLAVKLAINTANKLDMFVFNRSNDIIWGAYGANAVHMSFLQEYIAGHLPGVEIGRYWQISTDYHAYCDLFDKKIAGSLDDETNLYGDEVKPYPMQPSIVGGDFDIDLHDMFRGKEAGFFSPFFSQVVEPMLGAFHGWKRSGFNLSSRIAATDWRYAVNAWLERRKK